MSSAARVLVTGAGGALGGHAARMLVERGAEVYGTRRRPPSAGQVAPAGVHWVTCDLSKPGDVRAAVEASRPAQVVHTVGVSGTPNFGALIAKAFGAGLPVVYARPFNLIGPGVSCATALGDITSRMAQLIRQGGGVLDVGDLDRWRDYLDVRDAAAACVVLVQDGEPGGVYNLCSGVATLMSDVVDQLLSMSGDKLRLRRVEREESVKFLVGDSTRLRTLGWSPAYDLRTSLRDGLQALLVAGGADQ